MYIIHLYIIYFHNKNALYISLSTLVYLLCFGEYILTINVYIYNYFIVKRLSAVCGCHKGIRFPKVTAPTVTDLSRPIFD
jgi:hypothetical protein